MIKRAQTKRGEEFFRPYTERPYGEVTVNTHAAQVAEELLAERQPILPFELSSLVSKHEGHKVEQVELGESMTDAMSQTSETWHDNGAADALNAASRALAHRADVVINGIRNGVEIPYPNPEDKQVTMGSLIHVQFSGDDLAYPHFLTGMLREAPDALKTLLPEDTAIVTVSSPFGRAILGSEVGDTCTFHVGSRNVTLSIAELAQLNPDQT